ncbi:MAG: CocE/NonD family hydrolase, partial [Thermoplasmatota archaeon]
ANPTTGPSQPGFLSPQAFTIRAPETVMVPSAADGKRLEVVLYRPDTAERVPVYVNFSPYWGDTAAREGDAFSKYFIHEYVPRGYAVALASVRGTGHSEGCFQIGGDLELKDAYDVVDFLSKQPWSSGNVGAGAKSYDATTQNGLVAKFPHPALKTLFHVSGITDMYRYNGKDGVSYANGLSFTPHYAVSEGTDEYGIPQAGSGGGSPMDESPQSLARLVDDLACPELARHAQSGEGTAASGLKDAYWQERDWIHFLPQSSWNGSVLFVHGFQDWNVKPDHADPWLQELAATATPSRAGCTSGSRPAPATSTRCAPTGTRPCYAGSTTTSRASTTASTASWASTCRAPTASGATTRSGPPPAAACRSPATSPPAAASSSPRPSRACASPARLGSRSPPSA